MSKTWLVIAAVVAVLLAGPAIWYVTAGDDERETAIVERGAIDVSIQTVGTLQATGATTVRTEQPGAVEVLGVDQGDVVEEGDIIALLDLEPFDRRVMNAEQALEQAEYALQAAERRSADDPDSADVRLALLSAVQSVESASVALEEAIAARQQATIVSPASGTVIDLSIGVGDVLTDHQPIARIASMADLTVIADVDELDLPNVEPGAEARFRLDAFPATEIDGVVVSTAPQARQQGGATVFATKIVFDPPDDLDIRPGMNASVTIVTAAREDVLLIPEAELRTVGDRSFVSVMTDDGVEEREVVLGYREAGKVEVVSGLAEGERVVLG